MENNTDDLKQLIEKLKTFTFFDRLFRWHTIKSLLVDAASDFQGVLTSLDNIISGKTKLESEKSEITKDLQLSRETVIKQENEINRLNGICQDKDPKITKLSNDLASEKTRNGSLQDQINILTGDIRVNKETIINLTTENDRLNKENATKTESLSNQSQKNIDLTTELAGIKQKLTGVEQELSRVKDQNTQLVSNEEFRKTEHSNAVASLQRIQEQIQKDRTKEVEERHQADTDRIMKLKETWSNHEELVKLQIKQICSKHTIEYLEKVPFKGSPDNTIKVADEFIIFDAKSPGSDDLSNFSQYLKIQSESVKKYVKEELVKKDIFLVVPSNTLEHLEQFVFHLADYTVFIISIDALEPVILSLKKIEEYEFAEQLNPEDRDNICRVLGKFAHLSKRRIQIDSYFAKQVFELAYRCETDLPTDIHQKVIEFEKSEKLNPPSEKRAKQINLKELEKDNTKIKSEAGTQGIVIQDDVISTEIDKLPLYKEDSTE